MNKLDNMPSNLKFDKILKQVEDIDIDEDSLDLKSPKRTIVDISTDTFIKIIFEDDDNYYLFLNYVNTLDFYLNYYVNLDLMADDNLLLNLNELLEIYFKGGNVMNYHFRTMVTDEHLKELFSAYFKKSDFDFSTNIYTNTDNRFNQLKKYVYPRIISFLIKTTKLFNDYLENVRNGTNANYKNNPSVLQNFHNNSFDIRFLETRDTIKDVVGHPRFKFCKEIIDQYRLINTNQEINRITDIDNIGRYVRVKFSSGNIIQFIPKCYTFYKIKFTDYVIDDFNKQIDNYNQYIVNDLIPAYHEFYPTSKYHASLLYPYYKYLVQPINQHEIEYSMLVDNIIKYNFSLLQLKNFYTKEKIDRMLKQISDTMNTDLVGTYYEKKADNVPNQDEMTNPDAYNRYTINKTTTDNPHIELESTNNFIVYNNFESPTPLTSFDFGNKKNITSKDLDSSPSTGNNVHYVSGNLLIRNVLGNRQILDFDLFRIKFNMVAVNFVKENDILKNKFKIPSEFIDVSITIIDSNVYNEDHEIFIMPIKVNGVIIPDIPVKSHSYTYFIYDLVRILFVDFNFFPWMKGKYEKRLKRLLLLLHLYDGKNGTNYLDTLFNMATDIKYNLENPDKPQKDLSSYSQSKVHLESYKEYSNIFDLVYVDNKYGLIKQPVKMLLIISETLKQKNPLNIINHFRTYIKLTPLKKISNLQTEFIQFLNEIIQTYQAINPKSTTGIVNSNTLTKKQNYSKITNK